MKTGLYRLDLDMDWGVAHLYEHLLIRSFRDFIEVRGYLPYLYGWLSGETFQGVLFLEYGFYNPAVEELFKEFILQTSRVDFGLLENEIRRCEAEGRVLLEMKDRDALMVTLQALERQPFIDVETEEGIEWVRETKKQPAIFREKHDQSSFRQVTVAVGLPSTSNEDKAIFLRLTPIIFDALNNELFDAGMYEDETSWPVHNRSHDAMLAHAIYTVREGALTNNEIGVLAKKALVNIRLEGHKEELEFYANDFVATPTWNSFPIDYYRQTGLLVSRRQIADLLTSKNVQHVIGDLEVQVARPTAAHYRVVKR